MAHDASPLLRERTVDVAMPAHGVFALESHHATTFRMDLSAHAFLEVIYVIAGAGRFLIGGREHRCRARDVVVVPVGQLPLLS